MAKRSPVPPGAFAELDVNLIDEGKFRQQLERHIRRAHKELRGYENESGDGTGKAVIVAKIVIERTPSSKEHFNITYGTKTTVPIVTAMSIVKERGEKLLCQPIGASEYDPDQMALYDAKGLPILPIDDEPSGVAGSIKPAKEA